MTDSLATLREMLHIARRSGSPVTMTADSMLDVVELIEHLQKQHADDQRLLAWEEQHDPRRRVQIRSDEPVAPSSPPADPDPEPSRADKLRAALKPAGVKVTVLGEANEPAAALSAQDLALARDRFEDPKDQGTFAEGFERGRSHEAKFRVLIDQKLRRLAEPPKPAHEREPPHCSSCSCGMPTPPPAATQVEEVLCAGVVVSSPHDRRITLRFETDEQFRAAEVLIGIADCQVIDTAVTKEGSP